MKEIYLAGGCFWGMEAYIASVAGVLSTETGYANGKTEDPTYEEVCYEDTGHAETVKVQYDEEKAPLNFLLELYFEAIDPTAVNRQGPDIGEQYRSGIYYTDEEDLPVIREVLEKVSQGYDKPLAVEVKPLINFYRAEEYHQKYLQKRPGGYCHISPFLMRKAREASYKKE